MAIIRYSFMENLLDLDRAFSSESSPVWWREPFCLGKEALLTNTLSSMKRMTEEASHLEVLMLTGLCELDVMTRVWLCPLQYLYLPPNCPLSGRLLLFSSWDIYIGQANVSSVSGISALISLCLYSSSVYRNNIRSLTPDMTIILTIEKNKQILQTCFLEPLTKWI